MADFPKIITMLVVDTERLQRLFHCEKNKIVSLMNLLLLYPANYDQLCFSVCVSVRLSVNFFYVT